MIPTPRIIPLLAIISLAFLACETSDGLDPDVSVLAGDWMQQSGDTTHVLALGEYSGFSFRSTLSSGDTLRAFRGTYDADSTDTLYSMDLNVGWDYGRGTVNIVLPCIYEVAGETLRVAMPDSLGWPEAPPNFTQEFDWFTVYDMRVGGQ